jgi:hypothetical protein
MIAMGLGEYYISVIRELLLIPAGAESVWTAIVTGVALILLLWLRCQ